MLLKFIAEDRETRIGQANELGEAYEGTAMLLGDVVEADDEYTGSHTRGVVWLVDPETGRQVRVDTSSRDLQSRFAAAAAEERTGVARMLSALAVPHVVLSTSGDWLRSLAVFLRRGRAR